MTQLSVSWTHTHIHIETQTHIHCWGLRTHARAHSAALPTHNATQSLKITWEVLQMGSWGEYLQLRPKSSTSVARALLSESMKNGMIWLLAKACKKGGPSHKGWPVGKTVAVLFLGCSVSPIVSTGIHSLIIAPQHVFCRDALEDSAFGYFFGLSPSRK